MKEILKTPPLPKSLGPYSQSVKTGNLIFVSGQIPIDPISGHPILEIEAATHQCMDQIQIILESEGLGLKNIVRMEIFLKEMSDFQVVNEIYKTKFQNLSLPTRQVVQVVSLPKNAPIEISCIGSYEKN